MSKKYTVLNSERIIEHLSACSKSKESISDYCTTHNIPQSTFYNWRKSIKKSSQKVTVKKKLDHSFIEIAHTIPQETFRLHIHSYTLDIPLCFNPAALTDIVSVLSHVPAKSDHGC